ncbi:MAG: helix-hairpin-helix domain-containing protein [Acidimicrobiia bacterium]
MKRFLVRLVFLAALGYLVWRLREGSHDAPGHSAAPPRAPDPSPAPPQREAAPTGPPDDLQRVKGIGPVYASRLGDIGIDTFGELDAADPAAVAEALDVAPAQVEDWQEQARAIG